MGAIPLMCRFLKNNKVFAGTVGIHRHTFVDMDEAAAPAADVAAPLVYSREAGDLALELSKQAYELCCEHNATGLREFLEAHPDVLLYLYAYERRRKGGHSCNVVGLAASSRNPKCLEVLLDYGADMNIQDRVNGETPLFSAVRHSPRCTQLLLEKNADIDIASNSGVTALRDAAIYPVYDSSLPLLIEAKADVNHQGTYGYTVAHWVCSVYLLQEDSGSLRLLIESNADLEAKDDLDRTPLFGSCKYGRIECLKVLIEAKADLNSVCVRGQTGFHVACENGHTECLRLLVENKAGLDFTDDGGETGLMYAVANHFSECVQVLIEAKADMNLKSDADSSALTLALVRNAGGRHSECLKLLLDHASADAKAHALGAVLESADEFPASEQALAFMLLVHDANVDAAAEDVSNTLTRAVTSMYANTHLFIERWYGVALNALSVRVEVDRRVGLGMHGLYQEPLERVLQYLGLSMDADQMVNNSLDGESGVRRVLLPNCARNADHWFQLLQRKTASAASSSSSSA
jgi:ankyrin repeat protein